MKKARVLTTRLGAAATAACLVAMLGGRASAALLSYDPFLVGANPAAGQYQPGPENTAGFTALGGQNPTVSPPSQPGGVGFYSGPWVQSGGDSQGVIDGTLTYPGLQGSVGGSGRVQELNENGCCTAGRTGRPIAGGGLGVGRSSRTIYESMVINFGQMGTDTDNGNIGKHAHELWNSADGTIGDGNLVTDFGFNYYGGGLTYLTVRGSSDITNSTSNSANLLVGGNTVPGLSLMDGKNHLMVLKFQFNPATGTGAGPDVVSAFLDPIPGVAEPAPNAQVTVAASDLFINYDGAYTQYQFTGGGHIPGAGDEIRWGDTFGDVTPAVPEPASVVLMLVGAVGLFAVRRR
jgi:hypothetical protein